MKLLYDPISGITQYIASSTTKTQPIKFVANISERDSLDESYKIVWVIDASADSTVDTAGALYGKDSNGNWTKLSEAESFDLVFSWDSISDKPSSSVEDIDSAVANSYVPAEPVLIVVSESDNDTGYIVLTSAPRTAKKIVVARSGVVLSNKQIFGDGADYDILNNNQLHINNNGGATNLSGSISTNDKILVTFLS